MKKPPSKCTLAELRPYAVEYARRMRLGYTARPKVLRPCPKGCGKEFGARDLRVHIPKCRGER